MAKPTVASLWIGGALSILDQVCLLSFVRMGHKVVLYHYFPLENIPSEIETRDAREIFDDDDILIHRNGSPAMHADIFRIHLLSKTDMIWVDTDLMCLKPLDDDAHIYCWETEKVVTNCILRLPQDSPALAIMRDFVQDRYPIPPWALPRVRRELIAARDAGDPVHVTQQRFTTYGPNLLKWALNQTDLIHHADPIHVYLPLPPTRHRYIVKDKFTDEILNDIIRPDTKGMHMWSTNVRKNGWLDKIEPGSFLALKAEEVGLSLP